MLIPKDLQRGHWVGSMLSFVGALLKSPAFWLSCALLWAPNFIWPEASTTADAVPLTDAEAYTLLAGFGAFVGLAFFTPFFIFRRMNAEIIHRRELQEPLHVDLQLVSGAVYNFGLQLDDLIP